MTDSAYWTRIATRLVIATLGYNVLEAGVAIWSGIDAGSVALVGFGLDAVIEFAAAAVLLWKLTLDRRGADPQTIEETETRAYRFVGWTFMALAVYLVVQSGWMLLSQDAPAESMVGILLAALSLVVMPLIAWGKLRAADHLGSRALRAEAKETLACSYLSFTLLLGLGLNAIFGWWWADPVCALVMVPWLVREGMEGVRGEHCDDD